MAGSKWKEGFSKQSVTVALPKLNCFLVGINGLICFVFFMRSITDLCLYPNVGMWKWVKRKDWSLRHPSILLLSQGSGQGVPFPALLPTACHSHEDSPATLLGTCSDGTFSTCCSTLAAPRIIPERWNQTGTRWLSCFNIRNFLVVIWGVQMGDGEGMPCKCFLQTHCFLSSNPRFLVLNPLVVFWVSLVRAGLGTQHWSV